MFFVLPQNRGHSITMNPEVIVSDGLVLRIPWPLPSLGGLINTLYEGMAATQNLIPTILQPRHIWYAFRPFTGLSDQQLIDWGHERTLVSSDDYTQACAILNRKKSEKPEYLPSPDTVRPVGALELLTGFIAAIYVYASLGRADLRGEALVQEANYYLSQDAPIMSPTARKAWMLLQPELRKLQIESRRTRPTEEPE